MPAWLLILSFSFYFLILFFKDIWGEHFSRPADRIWEPTSNSVWALGRPAGPQAGMPHCPGAGLKELPAHGHGSLQISQRSGFEYVWEGLLRASMTAKE